MKLKIQSEAPPTEKEVFLKLQETEYGVSVVVCDESGNSLCQGKLVEIRDTGCLFRWLCINPDFRFTLEDGGRLKEVR